MPASPRLRRAILATFAVGLVAAAAARADSPADSIAEPACTVRPPMIVRPGIPLPRLESDSCNPFLDFRILVPEGALQLAITTRNGLGNANLFARHGSPANDGDVLRSTGPTNLEAITVANPQAGIWFMRVQSGPPNFRFAGVILLVEIEVDETDIEPGVPQLGISEAQPGRFRYFRFNVPPGTASLQIDLNGGSGNADLFVQQETLPTSESFTSVSAGGTNNETVDIPSPQGGPWKAGVFAYAAYAGVDVNVTLTPGGGCVPAPTVLCLQNRRFSVGITFLNQHAGNAPGVGKAIEGTQETGAFWFFSARNTELVLKILDGRGINGKFWFFWAA